MATAHRPGSPPLTLFVTGTDTEVGKTYCAALLARRLRYAGRTVAVYKPVASGCRPQDGTLLAEDAWELWSAAGRPRTLDDVCPQRFQAPLAPPEAARLEDREVDAIRLREAAGCWEAGPYDVLVVEGAGGLMSPLADGLLNIDLAQQFPGARVILVAANRLGVIHQVLAACEAAAHRGLTLTGILLSQPTAEGDPSVAGNAAQIARYTEVPVLGQLRHGDDGHDLPLEAILGQRQPVTGSGE